MWCVYAHAWACVCVCVCACGGPEVALFLHHEAQCDHLQAHLHEEHNRDHPVSHDQHSHHLYRHSVDTERGPRGVREEGSEREESERGVREKEEHGSTSGSAWTESIIRNTQDAQMHKKTNLETRRHQTRQVLPGEYIVERSHSSS